MPLLRPRTSFFLILSAIPPAPPQPSGTVSLLSLFLISSTLATPALLLPKVLSACLSTPSSHPEHLSASLGKGSLAMFEVLCQSIPPQRRQQVRTSLTTSIISTTLSQNSEPIIRLNRPQHNTDTILAQKAVGRCGWRHIKRSWWFWITNGIASKFTFR